MFGVHVWTSNACRSGKTCLSKRRGSFGSWIYHEILVCLLLVCRRPASPPNHGRKGKIHQICSNQYLSSYCRCLACTFCRWRCSILVGIHQCVNEGKNWPVQVQIPELPLELWDQMDSRSFFLHLRNRLARNFPLRLKESEQRLSILEVGFSWQVSVAGCS